MRAKRWRWGAGLGLWRSRAALSNNRIRLRPLRRGSDPAVDTVFGGLSPRSRYLRFHTPVPRLLGSMRHALLNVDGHSRAAIVAEARTPRGWTPVGIARLVSAEPKSAEFALAVVDDWQRRGVGRLLLDALADLARDLGFRQLYGHVLPENQVVIRLLRRAFPDARFSSADGVIRVDCSLDRPSRPLADADIAADLLLR